jgi:enoyl-CoA hydratase/carnithine racemase
VTGEEPAARSEPRPGVVRLTLSRPGQLNVLTWPLAGALHARLRHA